MKRLTTFDVAPRYFDSFWTKDLFNHQENHSSKTAYPAVNIIASENEFWVEVAAPGLEKEDFSVVLENELLTISYTPKHEEEPQSNYLMREFNASGFSRSFRLPKGVVADALVKATYTNGVLKLHLPKREEAKPKAARQIAIQ